MKRRIPLPALGLGWLAPLPGFTHPGHGLNPSAFDSGFLHLGIDHVLVPLAVALWIVFLCAVVGSAVRHRFRRRDRQVR